MTMLKKQVRVVNKNTIDWVRGNRDGFCLYGISEKDGCIRGLHVHHINSRGSGGDDIIKNLITLCPKHHELAENNVIKPEKLRSILIKYFGYVYEE